MPQPSLEADAVSEALKCNWAKAVNLNREILKENPNNTAALNRLAKAYRELGDLKRCKATYKKVLGLDKYNSIALKNLRRIGKPQIKNHTESHSEGNSQGTDTTYLFIEEPGKTKLVHLINVAPASTLADVNPLDTVFLYPKRHTVLTTNEDGKYLGALPDDLAKRITTFIKGGNRYCAYVKSVGKKDLTIIIREVHRCARFKNQPSFAITKLETTPRDDKARSQYTESEECEEEEREESDNLNL